MKAFFVLRVPVYSPAARCAHTQPVEFLCEKMGNHSTTESYTHVHTRAHTHCALLFLHALKLFAYQQLGTPTQSLL